MFRSLHLHHTTGVKSVKSAVVLANRGGVHPAKTFFGVRQLGELDLANPPEPVRIELGAGFITLAG